MSVPNVVTTIQNLYNSCKPDQQNIVCISDFHLPSASEKFDVVMALKKKKIGSAYPMKTGYCNQLNSSTAKTCKYVERKERTLIMHLILCIDDCNCNYALTIHVVACVIVILCGMCGMKLPGEKVSSLTFRTKSQS